MGRAGDSGGARTTITGTGFTGATAVWFGNVVASAFTVSSDTKITATSPAHGGGAVDVKVVNAFGTSAVSPADQFTYLASRRV